jgi:hypothetical protein
MTAPGSAVRPYEGFSHADWATLAREYLMAGHLVDRAGMPHLISRWGRDEMTAIAIDEWMGASPVYTRRTQRALGFSGDDVATMFKGMQIDIGAPPEFLDFRFDVHDERHGSFHLAHCGALMDVEPMGDDYVHAMCHTIEDPTFEATACASNPRARLRPVHRPPRRPADRHPHCAWTVTIDDSVEPLALPSQAHFVADTRAAAVSVTPIAGADGHDAGRDDYAGPLDPDLRMEDFSSAALSVIAQEASVQTHLLTIAFAHAIERRHGHTAAVEVTRRQMTGAAGVAAHRLTRAFDIAAAPAGLAWLIAHHPAFGPSSYVDARIEHGDADVRVSLRTCAALDERDDVVGWPRLLVDGHSDPLVAIARVLDVRYEVVPTSSRADEVAAWTLRLGGEPHREFGDVTLAKFSTGAEFMFRRVGRRPDHAPEEVVR